MLMSTLAGSRGVAQPDNQAPGADKTTSSEKSPAAKPGSEKDELPPLPPEKSAQQTMVLDGKTLHYTVTVGALPVRDSDGKVAGEVVIPLTPCRATIAP